MKKSFYLYVGAALIVVIALGLWRYSRPTVSPSVQPSPAVQSPSLPPPPFPATATPPTSVAQSLPIPATPEAARVAEAKHEQETFSALAMFSISFYGKVVDEKGNVIPGARADISAADLPFGKGSDYIRTTDASGLFSITGIHGAGLIVTVSKDGYYSLPQSRGNFGYAIHPGDELPPHPNPNDPAIFVLKKMGQTEPLIVVNKDVDTTRDGTPTQMNLHTGQTYHVTDGDIQVESWVHDKDSPAGPNHPYDWRCRISVPNGGLVQSTGGDFDFEAPTDGYQSEDVIDMSASDPNWAPSATREYFLKLSNGQYARIQFVMGAGGNNGFHITSYLNPQPGHRNLEYDQNNTAPAAP